MMDRKVDSKIVTVLSHGLNIAINIAINRIGIPKNIGYQYLSLDTNLVFAIPWGVELEFISYT
jgi:hypothetical protein